MPAGKVAAVQPPQVLHGDEVVTILVGHELHSFTIHKHLICSSSPFFDRALNGEFIEGRTQTITLVEEDPDLFQLVYDWLYSGRVADGVTSYIKSEEKTCSGDVFWWKVRCMGDRLLIKEICVIAISMLQKLFSDKRPTIPSREFIVDLFDSGSLPDLEKYIVEHVRYWIRRTESWDSWIRLPEAHARFGSQLAQYFIYSSTHRRVGGWPHPQERTAKGGAYSPFILEKVSDDEFKEAGGGTQLSEKHLCCAKLKPASPVKERPVMPAPAPEPRVLTGPMSVQDLQSIVTGIIDEHGGRQGVQHFRINTGVGMISLSFENTQPDHGALDLRPLQRP